MKKLKILTLAFGSLIIAYFGVKTFRSFSVVDKSMELRSDHFVVFYQGIYTEEAQEIAYHLEENYDRIRIDLGDPDHEIIKVYVHPTQTDFNKKAGLPNSTANGTSRGPNEFHVVWTNWFNSIFPDDPIKTAIHEFTHCVQLNILIADSKRKFADIDKADFDKLFEDKFINDYPQWFWEAISDYEAGIVNTVSVRYGMSKNLTLKELNTSNHIYNVGYTLIQYIVENWGKDKIPALITSYVDINTILGVSESDFEKGWADFVDEKY